MRLDFSPGLGRFSRSGRNHSLGPKVCPCCSRSAEKRTTMTETSVLPAATIERILRGTSPVDGESQGPDEGGPGAAQLLSTLNDYLTLPIPHDLRSSAVRVAELSRSETRPGGDALLSRNLMQLGRVLQEVQKTSMLMRMVAVGTLFRKMSRLVRDLARRGKSRTQLPCAVWTPGYGARLRLQIYHEQSSVGRQLVNMKRVVWKLCRWGGRISSLRWTTGTQGSGG